MSYELCIYSRQDVPVNAELLKRDMISQGWEVRILNDTFRGSEPLQLLPDGSALQDVLLAGWRVEQTNSKLLDAMFAAGNKVGLREMCEKDFAFVTCGLDVTCPFVFDPEDLEFDSEAELRQIVGDEVVDFRKEAKVFYYLRLSGMNVVTAADFIDALWKSIAVLSEGLLDDSQEGAFYFVSPQRRLIRLDSLTRQLSHKLRRLIKR